MRFTLAFHVFNKESWIAEVVRSWLDTASGDHSLEVLAVYDSPHDNSAREVANLLIYEEDYAAISYRALYGVDLWEIGADNLALAEAKGEILLCIQDDNWMYTQDWDKMLAFCYDYWARIGCIGLLAGVCFRDNLALTRVECNRPHKEPYFSLQDCADAPLGIWETDAVTRPLAVPVSLARWLGGFDQAYYPMDWDETDFSLRARREGWHNLYVPFDLRNTVAKRDTVKEERMAQNYQRGKTIFMSRHGAWLGTHRLTQTLRMPLLAAPGGRLEVQYAPISG